MRRYGCGIVLLVCMLIYISDASVSCKDNEGNKVDWWIAYKIPSINGGISPTIQNGVGYYYMDNRNPIFTLSPRGMNDTSGTAMSNTLNQIYLNHSTIGFLMWSDQPPIGKDSASRAHAKGVMGFDKTDGFFLRHSIPRYPPEGTAKYGYPDSGSVYGQNLLCMSMDITNLNIVAAQFQINNPLLYSTHVPSGLPAQNIAQLASGVLDKTNLVLSRSIKLKSGLTVLDFAKSKKWGKDLWDDAVAPSLKDSMKVETWGRPLQPNSCTPNVPYNIENINMVMLSPNVVFKETKDHSKWGITSNKGYVCIGDINRMTSQRKRGGGTTCLNVTSIHSMYKNVVSGFDKC